MDLACVKRACLWVISTTTKRTVSNLKCLGSLLCAEYQTTATFYIEPAEDHESLRHLEVHYENRRKPFRAGIPAEWSEADVRRHVMVEDDEDK